MIISENQDERAKPNDRPRTALGGPQKGNSMNGYPVILNGDHAEFEAEHANTPPHERPDWPLPSFDARDWAAAFCKVANNLGYKDAKGDPIDEGWMISWFANSLMRGFDEHASRVFEPQEPIAFLKEIDRGTDNACWVVCAKNDPDSIGVVVMGSS